MELTSNSPPPDNTSSFILCPTVATLFLIPSTYTLLFLAALPGNALSLWVFCRCIPSVSPVHVYLSHLSASNLMSALTMPFLAAYYALGSIWPLRSVPCWLVLHLITPQLHINIYISLIILTLVAISRYAALIQNTQAPRPNTRSTLVPYRFFACLKRTSFARRMGAVVWVLAVGGIVPVTLYYSVKEATAGTDGDAGGGGVGVCYSPPVELGGRLSAAFTAPLMIVFFVFYLLVLLCYMIVLRHIRRSRRSTNVPTSHILLGRVLRNIVIIQVVLSVCLLPYHIFKPIFLSLAHHPHQPTFSPQPNMCHPLSALIELKNFLLLLAALRGATDPLMYFMLDKTFRSETRRLLRCNKTDPGGRQMFWSVTGSQSAGQAVDVKVETVDSGDNDVL
ncbi:probable G-protein coupled receptor 82 [Notolabrus celidotus]|uniref:probable G-protein coupled receptor 82 n=1 Tax=Notolabrus celidotus TaxID=1203425 RepID=UPI00148FC743|nr:probable G-protein coupled receptor 82 [Notolabrus celidotus]